MPNTQPIYFYEGKRKAGGFLKLLATQELGGVAGVSG
jgi:hypothetical protein